MSNTWNVVNKLGAAVACLLLLSQWTDVAQAAPAPLSIKSAVYNKKTTSLIVKTHVKDPGGLLTLVHSKGGVLGQTKKSYDTFVIPLNQLGDVPCQVEARLDELKVSKSVAGAGAECSKVPTCKILPFAKNTKPEFNKSFTFEAQVAIKDKKAAPLTVEWDFAGGAMGHPYEKLVKPDTGKPILSGKVSQPATFIKDNSRYHVRFAASDAQGRRCEAGVYVDIGKPPTDLPDITPLAQAAQADQPQRASGLSGETVVLPFEKRSMQNGHDSALLPGVSLVYAPQFNTINAHVYQKGLRPVLLNNDKVDLTYVAASNPADPVGPNSINSTSQSWPLGAANVDASLKKGELMERYKRPEGTVLGEGYVSRSLIDSISHYNGSDDQHAPLPDEGAYFLNSASDVYSSPELSAINLDHGRYMPGIARPYSVNEPQPFSEFTPKNNWFSAYWLPLTDIDDSGRVHPTSLFKVQAVDKETQTPLAATDVTLTASKDLHCRECHALGKIGANPKVKRLNRFGKTEDLLKELLVAPISDSVEDQEYAALHNMEMLHGFNDFHSSHQHTGADQPIAFDGSNLGCIAGGMCHGGAPTGFMPDLNRTPPQYPRANEGPASVAMHRLHGALQYNSDKSDVLRNEKGRYLCDGADKTACLDSSKSLFPVKDANGKILPMEENCLKCHSGQREQSYRDRMFTAGITCYQCHGDMMAVGQMYPKSYTNPDGNPYRMHWMDQPDCGSCHVGSGNRGKDGKNGFFSAGVKKLAFAEDDASATPNKVDRSNPDERRFAVPLAELKANGPLSNNDYNSALFTPLYRLGKDIHGKVACAACHGPAHGIWPNRDPNANDNATALELQGHSGSLLECNICHTAESFAKLEDLDDSDLLVADHKDGVLGGPHSLHPVNDPYWWKAASGDTPNADESNSGGWHNNYAKLSGKDGEDQCAACHGNDHKGTRLSKTPVDRVFDFSDVADLKKLKKVGIKSKVTVKAGTAIGCNTCHSVELSCTDSPNPNCGQDSEQSSGISNHAPSLAPSIVNVVIGTEFSQQLTFADPENDGVSITTQSDRSGELSLEANGMFSPFSWVVPSWASTLGAQTDPRNPTSQLRPPFDYGIPVLLTDDRGATANSTLILRLTCPEGQTWNQAGSNCESLAVYSYPPTGGLDAGSDWTYQVLAESGPHQTLSYSLLDPVPPGMSIDSQGKISWKTSEVAITGDQSATIHVQDNDGNQVDVPFTLTVCQGPMHWNSESAACNGSVHITSDWPYSMNNPDHFSHQITYTEDNNRPVTFSLINAPLGFEISPQGLISGDPSLTGFGEQITLEFTVQVAVAPDNWARQNLGIYFCGGAQRHIYGVGCSNTSPIQSTGELDYMLMLSANQGYTKQLLVTNTNNLPVTFSLLGALPGMSIDSNTGKVSWNTTGYSGQTIKYGILARDSSDGWSAWPMSLTVCPADTPIYDPSLSTCVSGPIQFISTPNVGASANKVYQYQVQTSNTNNLPVSYSLDGAPNGMTIDGNGLVSWDATGAEGLPFEFRITASDSLGGWTQQSVYFNVCNADAPTWDNQQGLCIP